MEEGYPPAASGSPPNVGHKKGRGIGREFVMGVYENRGQLGNVADRTNRVHFDNSGARALIKEKGETANSVVQEAERQRTTAQTKEEHRTVVWRLKSAILESTSPMTRPTLRNLQKNSSPPNRIPKPKA